jgi:predicted nucleic acid-binding protein
MLYVDTSVLVALCSPEAKSADVIKWYAGCTGELMSAAWCVTEFASAMGLKQRTEQLTQAQAQNAWFQFERVCVNDLQLLSIETRTFHKAVQLTLDATAGLRAGDALHLACALDAKANRIVTLDKVMANNAKRLKLKHVVI